MCLIALATLCFLTVGTKAEDSGSTAITHGFATNNLTPLEVGDKGSATNPTVILELVPDMKFSQIGYMIAGCEPVDISKLLQDIRNGNSQAEQYMNDICSSGAATYKNTTSTYQKFDLDPNTDFTGNWTYVNYATMTQDGYYERVANGTGLIEQNVTETYADGTIKSATYTRKSGGDFKWVPYVVSNPPATNHNAPQIGDRVYTSRTDYYYINYDYKEVFYIHKNTFLKTVLGVTDDEIPNYHVVVKTITPSELNANSQWVDRADLVIITNKSYRSTLCTAYREYSKIPYTDTGSSDGKLNFSNSNDLNWNTVMKLFNKIVLDEDQAGTVIDQTVFTEMINSGTMKTVNVSQIGLDGSVVPNSTSSCNGSDNNVFKLCLMLNSMDPRALYNMFLYDYPDGSRKAAVTEGTVNGRTTGVFNVQSEDAKTYWGVNTFMPPKLDGTASSFNDWATGESYATYETKSQLQYGNGTVNSRVYLFQSDMNLLDNLNNPNAIKSDGLNKQLFNDILQETGNTATTAPPSQAIRFVMGLMKDSKKEKSRLNILDLEPCTVSSTLSSSKVYLTEAIFRTRIAPLYTGKINIIHQSTAEFNGKLEDLNSTYDMIYMGLYYGRLNTVSGSTVYNDSTLNGKIYLHVGDMITSRNTSPYSVNWPSNMNNITRGPGNDITSAKKRALEDYLNAGLPIVADVDLYYYNSNYVDASSYLYNFAKSKQSKLLAAGSASTGNVLMAYFKKTGLVLHMEEGDYPKEYVGDTTTGTIHNDAYIDGNLNFNFFLEDSEYTVGTTYTARLFIDVSRDGIYSDDELVVEKKSLVADGTSYSITKNIGNNFIGVIPWKFVVTKDTNSAVRDTKDGFSAIQNKSSDKKVIRVLQITDTTASTMNLQQNIIDKGLFYKYTSNLNDYILDLVTIDSATFESWYDATNKFDKTASDEIKVERDKLKDYDMLILGFADSYNNISNQYGALDNIMNYIDSGKSVLFTHDVTSFYNIATDSTKDLSSTRGYNFNLLFRDYLGMDRYGVRTTDNDLKATKDTATKPSGGVYNEIQGYTYQAISKLADSSDSSNKYALYTGSKFSTDTILTTKAAKLNGGQITEYPYRIDDNLVIAQTHSQYYQLDLNAEDLIVWYTLAQSDTNSNGYFSCSANDASNNYYIYSKGNITYSGVGHSSILNNEMEVKLLVNTIIAAYGNGNEPPTIEVVTPGVYSQAEHDYSIYISVDYAETIFSEDRFEEISFIPRNNTLFTDKLYVKAVLADGTIMKIYDSSGKEISLDSSGYAQLLDGSLYHLRWSQSNLSQENKREIAFQCYYKGLNGKTYRGSAMLHILRRNLFDLD